MRSAKGLLRRIATEPLALFLLLGLGLFALEGWWSGRHELVVVSSAEVARIEDLWRAQMGRAATPEELEGLIEQHVREEVLHRAALELGLDRDDVIVRRRLAQKMAFLLEDESSIREPSTGELRAHWREHPQRWQRPARVSFQHVYWSAESRGEGAADAARATLAKLRQASDGGSNDATTADPTDPIDADSAWRALGDPFMLQRELGDRARSEIAGLFGDEFAAQLDDLPVGAWQGPVRSSFGAHLVRVLARSETEQPSFEEVRARVRDDLLARRRAEASERAYEELRARYRVRIER
ncbi:MAG TPA: peptidylprolyl isomerase [Thermoanaerobaculia bacterium]|nr:peptidylprolyl isomerase [Thermoanaerobaculia bacterium]